MPPSDPSRPQLGPVDARRLVGDLYRTLVGREGSDEEIEPYAEFLGYGGSPAGVMVQMLESGECQLNYFRNPAFRPLVAPEALPQEVPRLYVWHIPKTAGTSLREMLRPHVATLEFCASVSLSELFRMSPARLRSFRVICGHFGPMLPPLLGDVDLVTVTLVRDPVAMVTSIYRQWRDHGPPGHRVTELTRRLPFDEWCHHDDVRGLWSNPQARSLSLPRRVPAWPGWGESDEGEGDDGEITDDELARHAVPVFDGIDVVGVPEDLQAVYRTCVVRLGLGPARQEEVRENVGGHLGQELSAATRDWLVARNTVDAALVTRARDRRHELVGADPD